MYETRTYRSWVEDKELAAFTVKLGESDLFIRADRPLYSQAEECLRYQRGLIQEYLRRYPEAALSLQPCVVKNGAGEIVRKMHEYSAAAGVGPMAAVAGAIAEYAGRHLLKYSSEVIIENGGDIFMKTNRTRMVGIFAGESAYTGKLALEIALCEEGLGICASSGTVGPSFSFGRADAAVVVSHSAILADAWATRLGNMVKSAGDVDRALEFVKDKPGIKGVVIIIGEKMGVWGEIKLVKRRLCNV